MVVQVVHYTPVEIMAALHRSDDTEDISTSNYLAYTERHIVEVIKHDMWL